MLWRELLVASPFDASPIIAALGALARYEYALRLVPCGRLARRAYGRGHTAVRMPSINAGIDTGHLGQVPGLIDLSFNHITSHAATSGTEATVLAAHALTLSLPHLGSWLNCLWYVNRPRVVVFINSKTDTQVLHGSVVLFYEG